MQHSSAFNERLLSDRQRKEALSPTQHHSASTMTVIFFYLPFPSMRQDGVCFVVLSFPKEKEVQTVFREKQVQTCSSVSTMIVQCMKFEAHF